MVVGGSSGMGLATAHQVVAGGGTAVITGREQDWVWAAVEALSQNGKAWGITPRGRQRREAGEPAEAVAAGAPAQPAGSSGTDEAAAAAPREGPG